MNFVIWYLIGVLSCIGMTIIDYKKGVDGNSADYFYATLVTALFGPIVLVALMFYFIEYRMSLTK